MNTKWHRQFVLMSMMAASLWSPNAKAELLNFNLTFTQQGSNIVNESSNVFESTLNNYRVNNKDLLKLLATTFGTNWPDGASLAGVGPDLFVVDATGTNPVFNLSSGINVGDTNVTYFRFLFDEPVTRSRGKILPQSAGNLKRNTEGTDFGMVFFYLLNEQDGTNQTDLSFAGLRAGDFNSSMLESNTPSGTVPFHLHLISNNRESVAGDGTLDGIWTVVTGQVSSSSEFTGSFPPPPPFLPPPLPPIIFTNFPPPRIINTNPPLPIITHLPAP
jgi:hypothetical protein